jgi:hypothetical protein
MTIYRINTTAYDEEDFFIVTTLTEKQISDAIMPIILNEREGYEDYDNDTLFSALINKYPDHVIEIQNEIETIYL